ncbi:hypothetical protein K2173_001288 [Erythroxylum novogranatense]|uniref:Probable purine permease n=1 Tax=Erythroxylum novogranatense TaxID=1862640 RepID=A0AAV8T396_9ROSI|nr:hypothetical protein K2173_001288 [Erythroxylum novogranatense]
MGDQEVELQVTIGNADKAANPKITEETNGSGLPQNQRYSRWIRVFLYALLLLTGQSVAMLLGRLYFEKGGDSKWLSALSQVVGFPILIPYYFIAKPKDPPNPDDILPKPPSTLTLLAVYVTIGLITSAICFLYSIGTQYLPVSTYSLLCPSQLAFNCFFSYFLNSQKFTPPIINSLLLLTISSVLLAFNKESANPTNVSKAKYAVGFICTIIASAGYGLMLSVTQFCFNKIIKRTSFNVVMDMVIYPQTVAVSVAVIGLFASGEWNNLIGEMGEYQLGKVAYVMNIVWTVISWQISSIGCVGLIFEVSSLFSNAVSVLGTPIVPILAVFFLNEKMDGVKGVSMVLAVWGFISYAYQQYMDDREERAQKSLLNEVSQRRD